MRHRLLLIICVFQLVFGTGFFPGQYYETPVNRELQDTKLAKSFNFLVIGDWGRNGEFHQKSVSNQMNIASKTLGANMIVSVGDNFYPNGVQSTQDPQWKQSFEDVYPQYDLNKPWYSAMGNHDYYGDLQAQIDYSKISRRWNVPALYFTQYFQLEDKSGQAAFIFIDTNPFVSKYRKYDGMMGENVKKQDTQKQLAWLKSELEKAKKTAKWVFVVGHHPLYTGGVRKTAEETEEIRKVFEPVFQNYGVDAYFCGHEHDLQVIHPKGKVLQFLSGAGSAIRKSGETDGTHFAVSDGGFMSFSVTEKTLRLNVINGEGKILFSRDYNK